MFLDIRERYSLHGGMTPPMNSDDIRDALTAHPAPADLHTVILGQIRDNLAAINRKQDAMDTKLSDATIRIVRLEERDERLERAEKAIEKMDIKLDALLSSENRREGASGVFVGVRGWTPVIIAIISAVCTIATALYLAGRQVGVIQPSVAVQHEVRKMEESAAGPK